MNKQQKGTDQMAKLTKKQRHLAYKKALELLIQIHDQGRYSGICRNITVAVEHNLPKMFLCYDTEDLTDFKEFVWFTPGEYYTVQQAWFDWSISKKYLKKSVQRHQQTILEFCIEITK